MLLIQHPFFLLLIFSKLWLVCVDIRVYSTNFTGSPPEFKKFTITFCKELDNAKF